MSIDYAEATDREVVFADDERAMTVARRQIDKWASLLERLAQE